MLLLMLILTSLTLFSEGVGVTGLELLDLVDGGGGGGGGAGGDICWLLLMVWSRRLVILLLLLKELLLNRKKMFKGHEIEEMRNVQYQLTWKQVAQVVHPWGPHKQQGTSLA